MCSHERDDTQIRRLERPSRCLSRYSVGAGAEACPQNETPQPILAWDVRSNSPPPSLLTSNITFSSSHVNSTNGL